MNTKNGKKLNKRKDLIFYQKIYPRLKKFSNGQNEAAQLPPMIELAPVVNVRLLLALSDLHRDLVARLRLVHFFLILFYAFHLSEQNELFFGKKYKNVLL